MKKLIHLGLFFAVAASSAVYSSPALTGAGSTFIYPVLSKWASAYANQTGIEVNYQSIGSGGGLRQLDKKTVAFAASDKPLSEAELKQKHYLQFPAVIGGIVIVYHLPSIKSPITLSGPVTADIFSGKLHYWDNPAIAKLNPKVKLPHRYITIVRRSDGSGTTYNFSYYLSAVSKAWRKNLHYGTVINWPKVSIGGKGNAGVANYVKQVPGAIGYVEYAYAKGAQMPVANMLNSAGHIVSPSLGSFFAAAVQANWQASNGFHLILANATGQQSWPIVASTFVLVPIAPKATSQHVLDFFAWVFRHGGAMAKSLDYVAIPKPVYQKIAHAWQQQSFNTKLG